MDADELGHRDPERIAQVLPTFGAICDRYFRAEVEGLEHVPREGGAILFGNHCGSTYTIESAVITVHLLRRYGVEHPLYHLVHHFFLKPPLRDFIRAVGGVLASRDAAKRILREGGQFVVYPGGDLDSHKPFRDRHRVDFHGHTGFVRMAIEERVPLVPFVHVGTHETFYVISRGDRIARLLGLKKRLRLNVWPIILSFPFGLSAGPFFVALPLPSKVKMRVLPACRPWELGWDDPENPEHLRAALRYFTEQMQRALDELAGERRWPVLG